MIIIPFLLWQVAAASYDILRGGGDVRYWSRLSLHSLLRMIGAAGR